MTVQFITQKKFIALSKNTGYKETLLKSYKVLYETFEINNRQDSANKYFRLATAAKDSVYSIEKANNIQVINFRISNSNKKKKRKG